MNSIDARLNRLRSKLERQRKYWHESKYVPPEPMVDVIAKAALYGVRLHH